MIKKCFEVTKKFMDSNILPENSYFTISQLMEKEFGKSSVITMALRVFHGFNFVIKIDDKKEDTKYKWNGIKKDNYKNTIWKVLKTNFKIDDIVSFIGCNHSPNMIYNLTV